jgi:hypothetical protein
MVSNYDHGNGSSSNSKRSACLSRLQALTTLRAAVNTMVESYSEKVSFKKKNNLLKPVVKSKISRNNRARSLSSEISDNGSGRSGRRSPLLDKEKINDDGNDADDDDDGVNENNNKKGNDYVKITNTTSCNNGAEVTVVARERILTRSERILRYSRAWDNQKGRSAWILLSSDDIRPIDTQDRPWSNVLEQNRVERKWQLSSQYDPNYPTYAAQRNAIGGGKYEVSFNKWDSDAWMKGLQRLPTGGLKGLMIAGHHVPNVKSKKVTDIISDFVSTKGDMDVSMAIAVLPPEPITRLHRLSKGFVYAPNFLMAAASAEDPVRRFELVMAFVVAGLHFGAKPTRPFEPLLGETLQAALNDGSQIYCEQISTTPNIAAFELLSPWQSRIKNMKPFNYWLEKKIDNSGGVGDEDGVSQKNGCDIDNNDDNFVGVGSGVGSSNAAGAVSRGMHSDDPEDETNSEDESDNEAHEGNTTKGSHYNGGGGSKETSWTLSGQFEHGTDFKGNTFILSTKGDARVSFHDGYIEYTMPQISLNGILVGDRVTEIIGEMKFIDVANGLECVLRFDANKKSGIDGLLQGKTVSDQFRGMLLLFVWG